MTGLNTDGGAAFPTTVREWRVEDGPLAGNTGYEYVDPGMTLRDYFAAKAMEAVQKPESSLHDIPESYDRIAQHAYKMADAMLKARAK